MRKTDDALDEIEEKREDGYEKIDDKGDELEQKREQRIEKSRKYVHTKIVSRCCKLVIHLYVVRSTSCSFAA